MVVLVPIKGKMSCRRHPPSESSPPHAPGFNPRSRLADVLAIGLTRTSMGATTGVSMSIPPDRTPTQQYEEALFGHDVSTRIASAIENDEVLSSVKQQDDGGPFYATVAPGRAVSTRGWWFQWQRTVEKMVIGQGKWNQALLVKGAAMPPDALFRETYGLEPPALGMIVRVGQKPTFKTAVIREMVTASYAQYVGIGPLIYSQFYYTTQTDVKNLLRQDAKTEPWATPKPAPSPPGVLAGQLGTKKAAFVCTVSEAWQGDCEKIISRKPEHFQFQIEAATFAPEFVRLCVRAAEAGFWHMDIKRANMLYRTDRGRFELCFTDFDGYFCRILSPEKRNDSTRRCCIAATVACFLGEIRCQEAKATWERVVPAITKALKEVAGIDLNDIEPTDWCFFLRNVGEKRVEKADDGKRRVLDEDSLSSEEKELGGRFRNHLFNYFMEAEGNEEGNCFQFVEGKPLFPQILDYAFA